MTPESDSETSLQSDLDIWQGVAEMTDQQIRRVVARHESLLRDLERLAADVAERDGAVLAELRRMVSEHADPDRQ